MDMQNIDNDLQVGPQKKFPLQGNSVGQPLNGKSTKQRNSPCDNEFAATYKSVANIFNFSMHTFPFKVSFEQVGFSGSVLPQVPRGCSLMLIEDLSSFKAFLAVGSRAVK